MNVAFVSNVVYPFVTGGAQKRIHEVGRRLADRGHEVTVYGRHYWDGPAEREYEGMTLRAVAPARELYAGDRRSIREAVEFAARLPAPLARHADAHDVVVASVFPYFPVLSAWAGRLPTGTGLATTWHEVWDEYWHDYLGAGALAGRAVERAVAGVPQHPIAVSETTADRLATIGPSRGSIDVVPNGIDVDRVRSVAPSPEGERVLFAGRLTPQKGVGTLLRAFDRAAADRPDATLGVVGEGPERASLERLAGALETGDRITFHGFLDDHEALLARMRRADVFASASLREGFGMATLEAMAAGCTVVAADAPRSAASEVVGDGGLLAGPNAESLSRAIGRALDGHRPATDPVAVARGYEWPAVTDRALDAYRRAAGSTTR